MSLMHADISVEYRAIPPMHQAPLQSQDDSNTTANNVFAASAVIGCIIQIIYLLSANAALIQNCRQSGPVQSSLIVQQEPLCLLNGLLLHTR